MQLGAGILGQVVQQQTTIAAALHFGQQHACQQDAGGRFVQGCDEAGKCAAETPDEALVGSGIEFVEHGSGGLA